MTRKKLSFKEALDLYTTGGAYTMMEEHRLGKISRGFLADFVVIRKDVIAEPRLLKDAKVEQVYVNGERKL